MRFVQALKYRVWQQFRRLRDLRARKRYHNKNVTILSANCTGGIISHNLGLQFLSPTVNLYMNAGDFIKFCENLDYYLSIDNWTLCTDPQIVGERKYPVVWLDDILLYLVHYHSADEALGKWNERKKRIDKSKIVIFNNDREGMTPELKDRFEALPYKKVLFTHQPDEQHQSCFYLRGYETENCVGIITNWGGWFGQRPIDQFDWVDFLNSV